MVLHELRFRSLPALSRAFAELVTDPSVETCLADPRGLTLRFRAAPERIGALFQAVHRADALDLWSFRPPHAG